MATAGCGATAVAEEEVWEEAGVGVAGATWAGAGAAQGVVQGAAERNEAVESGVLPSSSRLRFEAAAVVSEAPAAAPSLGRGADAGVLPYCVASESDSDWSAWLKADGPEPCEEVPGWLLPDGAACGAESCTGAASVKMSGAQPWPMN